MTLRSASGAPERGATELSQLLHRIYEAAVDPRQWTEAVAAVAASLQAHKGMLFTPYLGPQDGGLVFPWNLSETDLQLWGTRFMAHDIWSNAGLECGFWQREGAVCADGDLVPRDMLEQSVFYREFLSTIDIGHMCVCQVFNGAPGLPATALTVYRPVDGQPFSRDDQAWLGQLVPHLSRALGVMHRLDTSRLQAASALGSLDRLPFGVALLNERQQVIHLNQAARTAIGRGDGLDLNSQGQLDTSQRGGGTPGLAQWLDTLRALDAQEQAHFSQSFAVTRSGTPQRQYALQCSPLAATPAWTAQGETAHFVVFITDPDAVRLPEASRLRQLYGFTEAQARVALALADGGSYKSTARQLGLSDQTLRTHAKEIYAKARVNRLPELVRTLLSLGQAAI